MSRTRYAGTPLPSNLAFVLATLLLLVVVAGIRTAAADESRSPSPMPASMSTPPGRKAGPHHPPASTMSLWISGPSPVREMSACTYTAIVSGGTPPYDYLWRGDNAYVSQTYDDQTVAFARANSFFFTIYLDVVDATGAHAQTSRGIQVSASGTFC